MGSLKSNFCQERSLGSPGGGSTREKIAEGLLQSKNHFLDSEIDFGDPRINVNLGDGDDIQQFLERFSNPGVNASDKEQQYLNRAADIASVLKPDFSQDALDFKSMNDIKTRLRSDPSTSDLNDYHNNYFILWSNWYDIHLVTEIENVKAEVRAVIEVKRDENGKVEKNDNGDYAITIHEFQLR